MNIFNAVKDKVTTRQAAEMYGLSVKRRGMCKCPFHNDHTPSMKVDQRFHCFGCQADGDVIDFTSRLFGCNRLAAALKLASDFGIESAARNDRDETPKRRLTEDQIVAHQTAYFYGELAERRNQLEQWLSVYAPKRPGDDFHPLFTEALSQLPLLENDLDILWSGDMESKKEIIQEMMTKETSKMNQPDKDSVYYQDGLYARDHKELEQFRSSHMENISCKKAIEGAIAQHFDGFRLNKAAVSEVLDQYGAERVSLVLAATVQTKSWDGRFSQQNKDWAFTVRMPDSRPDSDYDRRDAYAVTSHPAILDGFITGTRQMIKERGRDSIRNELQQSAIRAAKPAVKQNDMER